MKIRVTEVNRDRMPKFMVLKYEEESGKPGSILCFGNEPDKEGLQPGDWADLETRQKGQYTNLESLKKTIAPPSAPSTPTAPSKPYVPEPFMKPKHPMEQRAIAKSVALAQAVAWSSDSSVDDIIDTAERFFAFLMDKPVEDNFVPTEIPTTEDDKEPF
jgi:hypothetical protein